jgi:hypothetical protein
MNTETTLDPFWTEALSADSSIVYNHDVENSSIIQKVVYTVSLKSLTIYFKNSKESYTYFDVPLTVYQDLIKADSIGKYFASNIKKKYNFSKKAISKALR